MAYLDLRLADGLQAAAASVRAEAVAPLLDRPAEGAVLLSLREGRRSLLTARLRRVAGRAPFRFDAEPIFAEERLEAIRRYAIGYRLEGDGLAPSEDERLRAAGVSELEAAQVRALVDQIASRPKSRRRWGRLLSRLSGGLLLAALPVAAATLLYSWLASQVEDRLGALIVAIMLVVGIVSPVALAGHPTSRRG